MYFEEVYIYYYSRNVIGFFYRLFMPNNKKNSIYPCQKYTPISQTKIGPKKKSSYDDFHM